MIARLTSGMKRLLARNAIKPAFQLRQRPNSTLAIQTTRKRSIINILGQLHNPLINKPKYCSSWDKNKNPAIISKELQPEHNPIKGGLQYDEPNANKVNPKLNKEHNQVKCDNKSDPDNAKFCGSPPEPDLKTHGTKSSTGHCRNGTVNSMFSKVDDACGSPDNSKHIDLLSPDCKDALRTIVKEVVSHLKPRENCPEKKSAKGKTDTKQTPQTTKRHASTKSTRFPPSGKCVPKQKPKPKMSVSKCGTPTKVAPTKTPEKNTVLCSADIKCIKPEMKECKKEECETPKKPKPPKIHTKPNPKKSKPSKPTSRLHCTGSEKKPTRDKKKSEDCERHCLPGCLTVARDFCVGEVTACPEFNRCKAPVPSFMDLRNYEFPMLAFSECDVVNNRIQAQKNMWKVNLLQKHGANECDVQRFLCPDEFRPLYSCNTATKDADYKYQPQIRNLQNELGSSCDCVENVCEPPELCPMKPKPCKPMDRLPPCTPQPFKPRKLVAKPKEKRKQVVCKPAEKGPVLEDNRTIDDCCEQKKKDPCEE